jgi:uncharacterized alpha-E superfamily protein
MTTNHTQKRIPMQITLSQEAYEFVKESVSEASRCIEFLIFSAKNGHSVLQCIISQKEDNGPAEIRTQDLRHVKATS